MSSVPSTVLLCQGTFEEGTPAVLALAMALAPELQLLSRRGSCCVFCKHFLGNLAAALGGGHHCPCRSESEATAQ